MATLSFVRAAKLAELLRSADPQSAMYVRVMSANQLALGTDPLQPTKVIDLSKEAVEAFASTQGLPPIAFAPESSVIVYRSRQVRRSGEYWVEVGGKKIECGSLKELLAEGLKALEAAKPGTLDSLSRRKARSRRIVARNASQLFDKPHLVKEYAEILGNGWYYGTNNSARETDVWLRRAAECAGLAWGPEFRTSLVTPLDDLLNPGKLNESQPSSKTAE